MGVSTCYDATYHDITEEELTTIASELNSIIKYRVESEAGYKEMSDGEYKATLENDGSNS